MRTWSTHRAGQSSTRRLWPTRSRPANSQVPGSTSSRSTRWPPLAHCWVYQTSCSRPTSPATPKKATLPIRPVPPKSCCRWSRAGCPSARWSSTRTCTTSWPIRSRPPRSSWAMARCLLATLFIPLDDPILQPLRADGHEIAAVDSISVRTEDALIDALQGVSATLASIEPYTAAVLAEAPDLRVISRLGVGYDAIDVEAATSRGIVVCTTPGTNQHSVADLAVGLILTCMRQIIAAAEAVRAGNWAAPRIGLELRGSTVGVVGTGLIGREVIKRLSGFEPRIVAHDIVESPELVKRYAVEYVSFDDLLRQADVITLHAPLLPETRSLIDATA